MTEKVPPDVVPITSEASDIQGTERVPEWLGARLRHMFTEVMDEPVPDEFLKLLKKLEDKERG